MNAIVDQNIEKVNYWSDMLTAMANEHRLRILARLVKQETSVTDLHQILGARQSAVSQHLAVLRKAGLVKLRRDAQRIYYSCDNDAAIQIMEAIADGTGWTD